MSIEITLRSFSFLHVDSISFTPRAHFISATGLSCSWHRTKGGLAIPFVNIFFQRWRETAVLNLPANQLSYILEKIFLVLCIWPRGVPASSIYMQMKCVRSTCALKKTTDLSKNHAKLDPTLSTSILLLGTTCCPSKLVCGQQMLHKHRYGQ